MNALIVILMLLFITINHEASHAFVAFLLGFKLNKLYLGIPISFSVGKKVVSTTVYKRVIRGVEYGVSWLILRATIDFFHHGALSKLSKSTAAPSINQLLDHLDQE
jgi:predicted secreted protein